MKKVVLLSMIVMLSCCNKPGLGNSPYDFRSVDRYLTSNLSAYDNHVAVLVAQDNQLIYKRELHLSANQTLLIASSSKWLSAAVIMSLVDEHRLTLDDSIGKFLPIFTQYGKGNITIRQLFSHTAGFAPEQDSSSNPGYERMPTMTLAQCVDSIAEYTPLINQPGQAFNYGGTGIQIGGRIAEVITGKSWQALFDERIGQPCHMHAYYTFTSASNPLIAGGAYTSAADYLNFLEMIVHQGNYNGRQVLSSYAIKQMTTDQTQRAAIQYTPYQLPVVRYGVGNWLDVVDASGNVLESSSPGLFGVFPWQDSKHHIAGIIFTFATPGKSQTQSLQIRQMIRDIADQQ